MTIDEQIRIMTEYLNLKLFLKDWHGVMDAAADIRELEAQKNAQGRANQ